MTIKIDGANTAANPGITGSDTDTGLQFGTDEVNIVTGGSTRATVNSSGHLIVGGTTAGNAGTRTVSIGSPGSIDGGLQLWAATDGASFIQFGDGTASASDHYRGLIGYEHNNDRMIFYTAGSKRLSILSGGGITFNNDTAAANALDDYEEGTWTPVIKSGTNTISVSGGNPRYTYTKIGNQVTVYFVLDGGVTTSGTTGGGFSIEGLPFSSAGTLRTAGPPCFFYSSGLRASDWPIFPHLGQGSSTVNMYYKSSPSANYVITNVNQVGSNTYVFWQITYTVS